MRQTNGFALRLGQRMLDSTEQIIQAMERLAMLIKGLVSPLLPDQNLAYRRIGAADAVMQSARHIDVTHFDANVRRPAVERFEHMQGQHVRIRA